MIRICSTAQSRASSPSGAPKNASALSCACAAHPQKVLPNRPLTCLGIPRSNSASLKCRGTGTLQCRGTGSCFDKSMCQSTFGAACHSSVCNFLCLSAGLCDQQTEREVTVPVLLGHASLALGNACCVRARNKRRVVLAAAPAARASVRPLPAQQLEKCQSPAQMMKLTSPSGVPCSSLTQGAASAELLHRCKLHPPFCQQPPVQSWPSGVILHK